MREGHLEIVEAEGDARPGLGVGKLRNVIIVTRPGRPRPQHVAYLRTGYQDVYSPMPKFGGRDYRVWRDLDRLLAALRDEWGFTGPITVYPQGNPGLRRHTGVLAEDLAA